jgi:hypothetical protein
MNTPVGTNGNWQGHGQLNQQLLRRHPAGRFGDSLGAVREIPGPLRNQKQSAGKAALGNGTI